MLDYGLRAMGVRTRKTIVGMRCAAILCGLAAMASGCKPAAPGPEKAAAQKTAMLLPVGPAPDLPVEPPQASPQMRCIWCGCPGGRAWPRRARPAPPSAVR